MHIIIIQQPIRFIVYAIKIEKLYLKKKKRQVNERTEMRRCKSEANQNSEEYFFYIYYSGE